MSSATSVDSFLARTHSSVPNRLDEKSVDNAKMHYLSIPVNALNTRSVTIQVFYDNNSEKPKAVSVDKEAEKKPLKLLVDLGAKKQVS